MPIRKVVCYVARCDRCGNDRENCDMWTPHHDSPAEALREAEGDDWTRLTDGRVLDPVCTAALVQAGEIGEYSGDDPAAPAYRIVPQDGWVFHGTANREPVSSEDRQMAYEATLPLSRREHRPAAADGED